MIGFTTPCFILENNSNIRNELIKLGYKLCECYKMSFEPKIICCTPYGKFHLTNDSNIIKDICGNLGVNCGKNEDLFLAIAALRNDSDIHQWFVTDVDQRWVNLELYMPKGSFELCLIDDKYMHQDGLHFASAVPSHKATVEELIKHFAK